MREWSWRWAPLPPPPDATAREWRAYEHAVVVARAEIRWRWREACSGCGLIRRIVPTGTASWEGPEIGPITLGPPTRFSVHLRPGQLRRDVEDVHDRLAAAFEVPDVVVRDIRNGWITVELIEDDTAAASPVEIDEGSTDPSRRRLGPPRPRHFPRRRRRGPYGGPRLGR